MEHAGSTEKNNNVNRQGAKSTETARLSWRLGG